MHTNTIIVFSVFLMLLCAEAFAEQHENTKESEHLQKCAEYVYQDQYADALKKCDQAIALTDDKAIYALAYAMKSYSHFQLGSYEQSIQDATSAIALLEGLDISDNDIPDDFPYSVDEIIAYTYVTRATSIYELALNTIGSVPLTDKDKQPYREALQDMNKAIALNPAIAEDEEIREIRNELRRLAH